MNQTFKKLTALSLTALMSLTAAPVSASTGNFTQIERASMTEAISSFAHAYERRFEEYDALKTGLHEDITFTLDDAGRSLLGFIAPVDISWFKDIRLSADVSMEENAQFMTADVLLNDSKICTFEYFFDMENMEIYMRIPELRDGYVKVNYIEAMRQQQAMLEQQEEALEDSEFSDPAAEETLEALEDSPFTDPEFMKNYVAFFSNLSEHMPAPHDLEDFLNRYSTILFDHMKDSEPQSDVITIGDVSENCTVHEGILSQTDARELMLDVVNTAKSDELIKELLTKLDTIATDTDHLYQDFIDELEDLEEDIQEEFEADGSFISAKAWVNEEDEIIRRSLTINDEYQTLPIYDWTSISQGSDVYTEIQIGADDGFFIQGSGTLSNGLLSGDYLVDAQGTEQIAGIRITDFDTTAAERGEFFGNYTLYFPNSSEEIENPLQNFELVLDVASECSNGTVSLSLLSAGATLGSITAEVNLGATVEKPDFRDLTEVYDSLDETAMNEYLSGITPDIIISNLYAAGVPEELLQTILQN